MCVVIFSLLLFLRRVFSLCQDNFSSLLFCSLSHSLSYSLYIAALILDENLFGLAFSDYLLVLLCAPDFVSHFFSVQYSDERHSDVLTLERQSVLLRFSSITSNFFEDFFVLEFHANALVYLNSARPSVHRRVCVCALII